MAGKYLDLEIKYLREDLEREFEYLREDLEWLSEDFKYLREDLEFIRRDIAQIQDLVGIERKDYFTIEELVRFNIHQAEAVLEKLRNDGDNTNSEKLEKEIKKYKEQNKLH